MRTLFITQELVPYQATGGMAVVSRDLPAALAERGFPHTYLLPYVAGITRLAPDASREALARRAVRVNGVDYPYELWAVTGVEGEKLLFVAQETIFGGALYDDRFRLHRNIVFGDAALAYLARRPGSYGMVHALDQLSALSLAYVRAGAPGYRLLLTILSAEYDFALGALVAEAEFTAKPAVTALLGADYPERSAIELGLSIADCATTSSPAYALDLAARYAAVLADAPGKLIGIEQGIDARLWDPGATDRAFAPMAPASIVADKARNRARLLAALADQPRFLAASPPVPPSDPAEPAAPAPITVGFIGRFCRAKGRAALYALIDALETLPRVQLLLIVPAGAISAVDRGKLEALCARHQQLRVINAYDQAFAELAFAGSDLIVMPSEQEPGGLCQKMAMRMAAVPLVTPTGGLRDSVRDAWTDPVAGDGFVAASIAPEDFLALFRAVAALDMDGAAIAAIRRNAMARDVSWRPTVARFADLYREMTEPAPALAD